MKHNQKALNNFLFTRDELAITTFENFRTGLLTIRTRIIKTNLDFERGIFVQYSFWKLTAGLYYLSPLSSDYFLLATLAIEF